MDTDGHGWGEGDGARRFLSVFIRVHPWLNFPRLLSLTNPMHRQRNQTSALALTALIMAAGTSAHAQFQFLTDQPMNAPETARRGQREADGYAAPQPAPRTYAAPEPERKGFFGRLFSRDAEPARPVAAQGYIPPGTTYLRDGVRYSDPAGYNQTPAPTAVQPWPQPQAQPNPQWPQNPDPRFAQPTAVPPTGQPRPLQPFVVSEGVRYAPGVAPTVNYSAPAPARTTSGNFGSTGNDSFSGQRAGRGEFTAPVAAPQYEAPSYPAPAQPQWPQPQAVAPQGYPVASWPQPADPRVIGSQAPAPVATAVVPPTGSPRPLTTHVVNDGVRYAPGAVPAGYPVPEPRYQSSTTRGESLDRPGFFSRLFGSKSSEEAPARSYPTSGGTRYAPGAELVGGPRGYDAGVAQPMPAPNHQFTPAQPVFTPPPVAAPQDPFSGQRPAGRVPEAAPQYSPPPNRQTWPAPRSSLDAPPGYPATALPPNLSPAEERAFSPSTRPEDRRYLMYLYAKTGRADMAEPLAQSILANDPTNQEALLAMSALFTDKKDAPRALGYATQLYRAYPDSNEALYYYGAANQLAGNYQEAQGVLRYLRLEKFAGKPFPYQLDLASAAEKTGDWRTQQAAYQELLDQNQVDDQTRVVVRRVLEPMLREHGNHVAANGTAYLLDSGQLWQERVGGQTQVSDRSQLHAEALREDVLVRESPRLKRRWADDTEGSVGWQTTWNRRWSSDVWAGGYQDGFLGGARLMHRLPKNGAVWLEAYGNERARDGLLLNSLDGRQHRLSLAGNYLIAERFQTYGALTAREVVLDGESLVTGLQANWGVEFLARRESPEFKFGYRGTFHANSRQTGNLALVAPALAPGQTLAQQAQVLDSLVLHQLHREGVYADLRDRLWGPLFYHLQGSADYAFERSSMEFGGRAGLTFQPRKSLEFGTELAYTTSAATTDGGSDAWEFGLSAKWWF
ncbi:MAG: Tetratricopeptide repeat [Verrucomicrobiota bacterium]|jgi:tetratricopeptide (TPR) repeat protein